MPPYSSHLFKQPKGRQVTNKTVLCGHGDRGGNNDSTPLGSGHRCLVSEWYAPSMAGSPTPTRKTACLSLSLTA